MKLKPLLSPVALVSQLRSLSLPLVTHFERRTILRPGFAVIINVTAGCKLIQCAD